MTAIKIFKSGVLGKKAKFDGTDRALSLFSDDEVRFDDLVVCVFRVPIGSPVPVQKQHHVGVLFQ